MFNLVGSKLASSALASARTTLLVPTSFSSLRLGRQSFASPAVAISTRGLRSLADLESMTTPQQTAAAAAGSHSILPSKIRPKQPASALPPPSIILTLSGPDGPGIVHRISGFLARRNMNIMDSAQFGDPTTGTFFMRVHASEPEPDNGSHPDPKASDYAQNRQAFLAKVKAEFEEEFATAAEVSVKIFGAEEKPRTLIMVSKIGHCLNDLLFRLSNNTLPITVPLIISNHADYEPLARANGIPFYHLPINAAEGKTKEWQEAEMVKLAKQYDIDMIVLARYMQILSPQLCSLFSGRIINIHHSFLPSFKGAKPYHQAFERGVKLIGATAHFVTADLDEGPIIEQAVERVDHAMTPADLVQAGSDVEARVLARAVKWTAERRVLLNGAKTVVFN
ncbi:5'-phosphoribosylglycinamide formyltransferase [Moesziomyces antarcticus T-34]|uniref:5'-phosphoribosylglycinamide formyltransferase n=1 Tax=Pseudozyma antarctica (strain T-34) TaxID=1151754 RepID=M9MEH5_PSEA3|nr:5'-phosphoribosylglycinamide formyltransferase [Moesziomyces antarcticus T-34]